MGGKNEPAARPETCENCGAEIGPLEPAFLHAGRVVCKACADRLRFMVWGPVQRFAQRHARRVGRYALYVLASTIVLGGLLGGVRQCGRAVRRRAEVPLPELRTACRKFDLYPRLDAERGTLRGRELKCVRFTVDATLPRATDLQAYHDLEGRCLGLCVTYQVARLPSGTDGDTRPVAEDPGDVEARLLLQRRRAVRAIGDIAGYEHDLRRILDYRTAPAVGGEAATWTVAEDGWYVEVLCLPPFAEDGRWTITIIARHPDW